MGDLITEFIREYLEEKIAANKYSYFLSRKKKTGYRLVDKPQVDFKECDITEYLRFSDKFNIAVLDFQNKFKEVFPEEYLAHFNFNIKNTDIIDYKLKIINKIKSIFTSQALGCFDAYNNTIEILKKPENEFEFRKIINHELLHLSSAANMAFCGLSQEVLTKKGSVIIGNGINEGYTEYLNKTYFSDNVDYSYHDQVQFASMIENIVGKDFMIDCYFNRGLSPLIKKLGEKIGDNSKAIDLILSLDCVLGKANFLFNRSKYTDVRFQLANFYIKELEDRKNKGIIDQDKYNKMRYLNVDRFIRGDDFYSENTVIEDDEKYRIIIDGENSKRINKKSDNISFVLDEENRVIKK
ncbi:MAG: hypothetical protein Q4E69_05065 [Bacilli bacterium]|nr:hypothetical protein [Bacilli bacterium]